MDAACRMVCAVLEQSGAEVRTSSSTREALEVLEHWKPDVLLSDIGMPGEDGYALIRQVRAFETQRGMHIPAAALTAYARDEDRQRILAAGFEMYVAKPVGPAELVAAVAGLAERTGDDLRAPASS
jgi:CheY-like chemotaxis protein